MNNLSNANKIPPNNWSEQEPDPQPGHYYVSAIDGPAWWLLLGPFTWHKDALERVEQVRKLANDHEPRSVFYSFGTCRMADDYTKEGSANKYLLSAEERKLLAV